MGTWAEQTKLTLAGAAANDVFGAGAALSADGNLALIGAPSRDCAAGVNCGGAFVFERVAGVWSGGLSLPSPSPRSDAEYGVSVALSGAGDLAAVGAVRQDCDPPGVGTCGAIYLFRRTGGIWALEDTLRPDKGFFDNNFGSALLISQDGSMVVARGGDFGGEAAVALYVFQKTGGTWSQEPKIQAPLPGAYDFLPVALSGDGQTLLAGEKTVPSPIPFPNGYTTYVFVRDAGAWTRQGPALSTNGSGTGGLSFDGDIALLGSFSGGTAGLYVRSGSTWSAAQVLAPDSGSFTPTAAALSSDARTVLLGVPNEFCLSGSFGCGGVGYIFGTDITQIPTLGEVGLLALTLLLAGSGAVLLRRRTRPAKI